MSNALNRTLLLSFSMMATVMMGTNTATANDFFHFEQEPSKKIQTKAFDADDDAITKENNIPQQTWNFSDSPLSTPDKTGGIETKALFKSQKQKNCQTQTHNPGLDNNLRRYC